MLFSSTLHSFLFRIISPRHCKLVAGWLGLLGSKRMLSTLNRGGSWLAAPFSDWLKTWRTNRCNFCKRIDFFYWYFVSLNLIQNQFKLVSPGAGGGRLVSSWSSSFAVYLWKDTSWVNWYQMALWNQDLFNVSTILLLNPRNGTSDCCTFYTTSFEGSAGISTAFTTSTLASLVSTTSLTSSVSLASLGPPSVLSGSVVIGPFSPFTPFRTTISASRTNKMFDTNWSTLYSFISTGNWSKQYDSNGTSWCKM